MGRSLGAIAAFEGGLLAQRQVSRSLWACIFQEKTYLLYSRGPKAGDVFRIMKKPSEGDLARLPKLGQIEEHVDGLLKEIGVLKADRDLAAAEERTGELYQFLFQTYFGKPGRLGLEQARYFLLDGEGEKYYRFVQEIQDRGYVSWVDGRAKDLGLGDLGFCWTAKANIILYEYLYGKRLPFRSNHFSRPEDPISFIHGTIVPDLAEFIQIGLARPIEAQKVFGVKAGCTPGCVSFWSLAERDVGIVPGYQTVKRLEYPVVLAVSRKGAEKIGPEKFVKGLQSGERTLAKSLPLSQVTDIFAPWFKIKEVGSILNEHGYGHIQVHPLGFDDQGQPIIPI